MREEAMAGNHMTEVAENEEPDIAMLVMGIGIEEAAAECHSSNGDHHCRKLQLNTMERSSAVPLELELQETMTCLIWMSGTEFQISASLASVSNCESGHKNILTEKN
ncbi:uncharacterized protein LOC143268014 [Peromyscus maniculatus bairdii]|uniref:uncharacterized protein LOC143268014 n=1 Tax=Peromyscus maniculatus bairdii TaxID=230844 RepID=UPI003FD35CF3